MDEGKAALMQVQVRRNAEDLQSYLKGLESWEEDIKKKDESLSRQKPILKEQLPPVRSQRSAADSQKRKKKKRKKVEGVKSSKPKRITSYDYNAWDKFDVDKACEDVDFEVQSTDSSLSSSEEEEEEEDSELKRKQRALMEKEKGNELFKSGAHEQAVERYGVAIQLDPMNAILPANRALALIKLERYGAAESDCTTALELDHTYVKAYLRRAMIRLKLHKPQAARQDYESVLKLEPNNKTAKTELEKLDKELGTAGQRYIRAVKRPPHLRSKKPLKRIVIHDTGVAPGGTATPTSAAPAANPPMDSSSSLSSSSSSSSQAPLTTASISKTTDPPGRILETDLPEGKLNSSHSPAIPRATLITEVDMPTSNNESVKGEYNRATDSGSSPQIEHAQDLPTDTSSKMSVVRETEQEKPSGREVPVCDSGGGMAVVEIPSVPQSSIQFQADWRQLRGHRDSLAKYFQGIPVSRYPVLLQQSLETDVFSDIIDILHNSYVKCGQHCLEELGELVKVQRFSVAVMFLSKQQKQGLSLLFKDLMEHLTDSEKKVAAGLAITYGVTLS